jgi:hypothetical protein
MIGKIAKQANAITARRRLVHPKAVCGQTLRLPDLAGEECRDEMF